jgi:hypothetical protein
VNYGAVEPATATNRDYPGEFRRPATPSALSPGALARPGDQVRLHRSRRKLSCCSSGAMGYVWCNT